MKPSAVSVIIPTRNRAHLVARAVCSALKSCSGTDEIIVVDDGSTDSTATALESYARHIKYVKLPHGGAGKARNHGVRIARNPLVAFLDSDDEWIPGYLEVKRRLLDRCPDILFCCSDFASRHQSGHIDRNARSQWHHTPLLWDEILGTGVPISSLIDLPEGIADFPVHVGNVYPREMAASYVCTITLVVRKHAAGDALTFAKNLPIYED